MKYILLWNSVYEIYSTPGLSLWGQSRADGRTITLVNKSAHKQPDVPAAALFLFGNYTQKIFYFKFDQFVKNTIDFTTCNTTRKNFIPHYSVQNAVFYTVKYLRVTVPHGGQGRDARVSAIIIQGGRQYRAPIVPQGSPLCAFPGQLTDPLEYISHTTKYGKENSVPPNQP